MSEESLESLAAAFRAVAQANELRADRARVDCEALWPAVLAGDGSAVAVAVARIPAGRRPSVSSMLYELGRGADLDDQQRAAWAIARLGTDDGPGETAWSLVSKIVAPGTEVPPAVLDLFRARGRAWSGTVVRALLRTGPLYPGAVWRSIAALVRENLVAEPDPLSYAASSLAAYPWAEMPARVRSDALLAASLRHTFDAPGTGLQLGSVQAGQSPEPLVEAYVASAPGGRAEVLDALLGTLANPLAQNDARGWTAFAGWLAPTDAELAAHSASLIALLAAPSRVSVGWAQTALARQGMPCDGAALVDVSDVVLARPDKGLVKAQLRLLRDAHARGDVPSEPLARVLADGLDPERPDLARAMASLLRTVLTALDGPTRDEVTATIDERLDTARGALRIELGLPASTAPTVGQPPTPPPAPVDLPTRGVLHPVRDVDELVELLVQLADGDTGPEDRERAYDGLVRLRPEDARALTALERSYGHGIGGWASEWTMSGSLSVLVRTWLGAPVAPGVDGVARTGFVERPEDAPTGASLHESIHATGWHWMTREPSWVAPMLTHRRTVELRSFVRSGAQLLSTPTSVDGSIDGATLLARLRQPLAAGAGWAPHDLGTALLRLDPRERAELESSGTLDITGLLAVTASAALRTLGEPCRWVRRRADRASTPHRPAREITAWLARDAAAGAPDDPVRGWLDTSTVLTGWWDHHEVVDWRDARWGTGPAHWTTVLVHDPDLLGAHLLPLLAYYAEKPRADLIPVVRALGRTRAPLHGPASNALVRLAAFRDITVRTATAEAVAEAARTGRLDPAVLGTELAALVGPDTETDDDLRPKLNRIIATLTDAARIHDHAEAAVLDTLRGLLPVAHRLRGAADAVELTAQLSERRGVAVPLPDGLAALARGRSSTRIAVAARRLGATSG